MNNKLRIASCLLGAIATVGLAQEAKAIIFSEGVANPAFGGLGLTNGTVDVDRDSFTNFITTNFTDAMPIENVRTFEQLRLDGEIPSNATLDSVEIFLFGEIQTEQIQFGNVSPTNPSQVTGFTVGALLDLDVNTAVQDVIVSLPTASVVNFVAPNPIPANTPPIIIDNNLPDANEAVAQTLTDPMQLNVFLDPGTIDFNLDGTDDIVFSFSGGSGFGTGQLQGRAEYAIEYNFSIPSEPIPFETESGVAVVAVSGLIAYRQLRKRRQS